MYIIKDEIKTKVFYKNTLIYNVYRYLYIYKYLFFMFFICFVATLRQLSLKHFIYISLPLVVHFKGNM